jgi:hypothetical protein
MFCIWWVVFICLNPVSVENIHNMIDKIQDSILIQWKTKWWCNLEEQEYTEGPVNRTTDNTITKRKWTTKQTTIYKTLHRKRKIKQLKQSPDKWRNSWHCTVFYVVLLCVFKFWVPCCDVRYDFRLKTIIGSSLPPVVCRRFHVLFKLFVFACV